MKQRVGTSPHPLDAVFLTKVPLAHRNASYIPDHAPDPFREQLVMLANGVRQIHREPFGMPLNPLARSDIFFAGIDPARGLRVLLGDRHADAVVCSFENTALPVVALRRALRFRPPVFVLEVSGRGWRPRDAALDFVMPRVDQVLTLTQASKAYVESTYRLRRPARVTGYSVDEAFFRPDAPLSAPPKRLGGYVLSVGDDHSRDYPTLLAACRGLELRVVVRTSQKLQIPAELRDRVELLPERLSFRALRDLYRQAGLVALPLAPADNPGGITALFEAMAMAKPVICSDTGATRDVVRDGGNAVMVPPGDVAAMHSALSALLADAPRAAALGREARRTIEADLSAEKHAARIAEAIRATLAEL